MKQKLVFVVMTLMLVLPVSCIDQNNNEAPFSEAPVVAPRDTVFDVCGPMVYTGERTYTAMGPYKLFDDFYFIGTTSVGSFVIDTGEGLILIDTGWGASDCAMMMGQLQELGFDPAEVKLILISHEHYDHYGCVNEFRENYCPSAKVGMSKVGWNYLRAWPNQVSYQEPRPDSIDMYLKDEQIIYMGNKTIKIFYTPGHSPGCVSFVIPIMDRGTRHVIGIMGGTGAPRTVSDNLVYWSSVEYFRHVCEMEKCDVGLGVHARGWQEDFEIIQGLESYEPNPLVIGTERFVTEYIQGFYDIADAKLDQVPPEHQGPVCEELLEQKLEECDALYESVES